MADNAEATDLKRRARRRLIGAIALVLALVIVPPWVMDLEPRPVTTDLTVQIPGRDAKRLNAPAPPAPAKAPEQAKSSEPAKVPEPPQPMQPPKPAPSEKREATAKAEPKPAPEPPKPAASKPAAKGETVARAAPTEAATSEAKRAEAILNAEAFVVPLGAFANKENVKSLEGKLAKAGVKYYTETVTAAGGPQTRVRAGPYPTRDAAEKVREQLKTLGLAPGNVTAKQ